MNSLVVTLISTLYLSLLSGREAGSRFEYMTATYIKRFSGQVYHDNLLFERKTKHALQCFRNCARREECSAFTFTPGQEVGDCRGHAYGEDDEYNESSPSPSTIAYVLPSRFDMSDIYDGGSSSELLSECDTSSDCAEPEAEERWACLENQCKCAPGYLYKVSNHDCVHDCDELDDGFLEYPGYQLHDSVAPLLFQGNQTFDDCLEACRDSDGCRSLNILELPTVKCKGYGIPEGPLEASSFSEVETDVTFIMRMCQ